VKIYERVFDASSALDPAPLTFFAAHRRTHVKRCLQVLPTAAAASHAMSCKYCRMLPAEVRRVVLEQVTKRDLVPVLRATGLKTLL
jgi:hypothetical protein